MLKLSLKYDEISIPRPIQISDVNQTNERVKFSVNSMCSYKSSNLNVKAFNGCILPTYLSLHQQTSNHIRLNCSYRNSICQNKNFSTSSNGKIKYMVLPKMTFMKQFTKHFNACTYNKITY